MASGPEGTSPGAGGSAQEIGKKATTALVCGILGIVCCPIVPSIVAIIFGNQAKSMIAQQNAGHEHGGKATAGVVLGYIGIALVVVWIILNIAGVAFINVG